MDQREDYIRKERNDPNWIKKFNNDTKFYNNHQKNYNYNNVGYYPKKFQPNINKQDFKTFKKEKKFFQNYNYSYIDYNNNQNNMKYFMNYSEEEDS